ncbi:MAG: glycosyltransferase [Actinomycetota bacterium]|nr:glycosyltransferase [Actinomycetota bacterium]
MSTRIVLMANNIDEIGGAQRVVHALASGFADRGFDTCIVGVEPREPLLQLSDVNYQVIRLLEQPYAKDEGPELQAQQESARAALQSILDAGPPGIIITAQVWAMEHVARCQSDGWRTIGQYHSSFQAAQFGPDLQRLIDAYSQSDLFLALTETDARSFTAIGFNNAFAMPNPIARWPEFPADADSRTITYLGRFSAEKAPMTLMQAWRMLTEAGQLPDWNLQFVGSGPHVGQLQEACAVLPRVRVHDQVADPYSVLSATGILAVPSLVEGLPLVIMEALASGVPVVASDCSAGVRELLADESVGVLVNRGDAVALARGLRRLGEHPSLRASMSARGPELMGAYDLDRIMDRWERVIADVMR